MLIIYIRSACIQHLYCLLITFNLTSSFVLPPIPFSSQAVTSVAVQTATILQLSANPFEDLVAKKLLENPPLQSKVWERYIRVRFTEYDRRYSPEGPFTANHFHHAPRLSLHYHHSYTVSRTAISLRPHHLTLISFSTATCLIEIRDCLFRYFSLENFRFDSICYCSFPHLAASFPPLTRLFLSSWLPR